MNRLARLESPASIVSSVRPSGLPGRKIQAVSLRKNDDAAWGWMGHRINHLVYLHLILGRLFGYEPDLEIMSGKSRIDVFIG